MKRAAASDAVADLLGRLDPRVDRVDHADEDRGDSRRLLAEDPEHRARGRLSLASWT